MIKTSTANYESGNNPLVSICIPAYNCEAYVAETLFSLLQQTYTNLEIVIVNDGSKDNTEKVVKSINDARVTYLYQENCGASSARNLAYRFCKGRFIKFMDADDLINPDCIESQLKKIIDSPNYIASARWGRFYNNDITTLNAGVESVWRNMRGIDWLIESLIEHGRNMMQPGIFLIPRNIIEKAGFWNEELSLIDDFDYMIRVLINASEVIFCEDALLMYRSGQANNLSGQKSSTHMKSAFKSLSIGISNILSKRNDAESRLACANTYQNWAFVFYPDYPDLCELTSKRIKELGGSNLKIEGGRIYKLFALVLGWKKAKRLKRRIVGKS